MSRDIQVACEKIEMIFSGAEQAVIFAYLLAPFSGPGHFLLSMLRVKEIADNHRRLHIPLSRFYFLVDSRMSFGVNPEEENEIMEEKIPALLQMMLQFRYREDLGWDLYGEGVFDAMQATIDFFNANQKDLDPLEMRRALLSLIAPFFMISNHSTTCLNEQQKEYFSQAMSNKCVLVVSGAIGAYFQRLLCWGYHFYELGVVGSYVQSYLEEEQQPKDDLLLAHFSPFFEFDPSTVFFAHVPNGVLGYPMQLFAFNNRYPSLSEVPNAAIEKLLSFLSSERVVFENRLLLKAIIDKVDHVVKTKDASLLFNAREIKALDSLLRQSGEPMIALLRLGKPAMIYRGVQAGLPSNAAAMNDADCPTHIIFSETSRSLKRVFNTILFAALLYRSTTPTPAFHFFATGNASQVKREVENFLVNPGLRGDWARPILENIQWHSPMDGQVLPLRDFIEHCRNPLVFAEGIGTISDVMRKVGGIGFQLARDDYLVSQGLAFSDLFKKIIGQLSAGKEVDCLKAAWKAFLKIQCLLFSTDFFAEESALLAASAPFFKGYALLIEKLRNYYIPPEENRMQTFVFDLCGFFSEEKRRIDFSLVQKFFVAFRIYSADDEKNWGTLFANNRGSIISLDWKMNFGTLIFTAAEYQFSSTTVGSLSPAALHFFCHFIVGLPDAFIEKLGLKNPDHMRLGLLNPQQSHVICSCALPQIKEIIEEIGFAVTDTCGENGEPQIVLKFLYESVQRTAVFDWVSSSILFYQVGCLSPQQVMSVEWTCGDLLPKILEGRRTQNNSGESAFNRFVLFLLEHQLKQDEVQSYYGLPRSACASSAARSGFFSAARASAASREAENAVLHSSLALSLAAQK